MASGTDDENEANSLAGHCGHSGGSEVAVGNNSNLFGLAVEGCNPSGKSCSGGGLPRREESNGECICAGSPGRSSPGRSAPDKSDYRREDCTQDNTDMLGDEEERHFCNVCFSFLYYKKYCFYELLRIYRNVSSLTHEEKTLLTESIYCKLYKMYLAVLNNYFFILNILLPQISTHIILHLLAHTDQRGDMVIVEDSSSDGEERNGESVARIGSVRSGTEDATYSSNAEEGHSDGRSSVDGEEKTAQGKTRKKSIQRSKRAKRSKWGKRIPREEYTINEILDHLTEEEKEKIDREYNWHNLDARLLCKDNPIVILKEIRSKLMSAKENQGISREIQIELELNLERSTSVDYLDVGYSTGRATHHKDETGANLLSSSSLFPEEEGGKSHGGAKQQGGGKQKGDHSPPEQSHGVCPDEQLKEEPRKSLPFPEHYNRQYHKRQEKEEADIPNGKGKSEDILHGGGEVKGQSSGESKGQSNGEVNHEAYLADHRKHHSEYAFPRLDSPPEEMRLGEWGANDEPRGETAAPDREANVGGTPNSAPPSRDPPTGAPPSGTPLQGEHVPPGRRITSAYSPTLDEYNLLQNMSKVRSTLRQFVRDWSMEGKHERDGAYEPMLKSLDKYVPITDTYVPKVLCPGSGLGRLPYEVAKKGYRSQGNEFSYFMLLASNFILNYYNEKDSLKIQPYCLNTLNRKKRDDHLKAVTVPDINTYNKAILSTDFSMCAGELIEVYDKERGSFDAVLTCFFIDTAKNIFLYIRTFANILKPNSLWCNVGPLLYHYSEMTNELSIELSWEEIELIISKWFTFVEIEWIDNYYTTNVDSMMQVQYHCIFFCAIRNDVPVEDPPMGDPPQGG
ncbi:hypothetical protein C922_03924 [Plasmodium inui San Antonio 1]|uniref:carnosine N-methyltransferase n=1 Tax=Plasmodium inui San Antonio 1 TaxID=1237626 RepID=W7AK17_9APIC|nr:hypothetical protein C922_03924 [Plasmodium inui San Antonio 1]EUD65676.1 hypothetical protein C922_03924 [Plasmodium inui San Antonio 1]